MLAAPQVALRPLGAPAVRVPVTPDQPAVLAADPSPFLPHRARTFVARACQAWGLAESSEAAALVADELVANAVVHARTFVELHLHRQEEWLVVAVHDRDPAFSASWWDCIVEDDADDLRGARYGLCIVRGTASHVGAYRHPDSGKVVWAALPLPDVGPRTIDLRDPVEPEAAVRRTLQVEPVHERPGWRLELLLGWRGQDPGSVDVTLRATPAHPTLPQRHRRTTVALLAAGLDGLEADTGLRVHPDEDPAAVVLELDDDPRAGVRAEAAQLRAFLAEVEVARERASARR
ncbi:ATP-binding protein [Motilibacter deserti]|uniref:ATP-binding protein n=1 Tax=Motilibacter deserti TaxID=2714956 RepID=UPI001E50B132|nr:ATP-binding protein [Motilibacter deserti]